MPVNVVADISHHNNPVNLAQAKSNGLLGVFHKATQGLSFKDPKFQERQTEAATQKILFGAYHFGDGSDGVAQADFFLKTVGTAANQLLVLDFEANTAGPSMTLAQAHAFVARIHDKTGRWPGFYCGNDFKALVPTGVDSTLANCWLWIAQFAHAPILPSTWKKWTFWQYTDGTNGPEPHEISGIGACDRDQFNGTEEELIALWKGTPVT